VCIATKKKTKSAIFEKIQENPALCVNPHLNLAAAIFDKLSVGDRWYYQRFVPHAKKRMPEKMFDRCCFAITFGRYSRNDNQKES
jgi:hypothetical protein